MYTLTTSLTLQAAAKGVSQGLIKRDGEPFSFPNLKLPINSMTQLNPITVHYLCSLCGSVGPNGHETNFGDPELYQCNGNKAGLYIERGWDFKSWVAKIRGHLITYHQSSLKSIPDDINPYLTARYRYLP